MTVQALLDRLDSVRSRGTGRYKAKCPAHPDKTPSLSIRETHTRTLLHCFSGCTPEEILAALRLEWKDLFKDTPTPRGQRLTPKPQKLDLIAAAHRFELAALDRRLRADVVLQTATNFKIDELSEQQFDRVLNAVARAYADRERAEFLETVADDFRMKAFHEREALHAT